MDAIFDFIEPFEKFLIILNRHDISVGDVRFFPAYRDFLSMRAGRYTYYASLETVSERYGIPVGTLRRVIKRFSQRLRK